MLQLTDLPFANGQWRLALGLKPLPIETWIEIDASYAQQLHQKAALLDQRYGEVFASLPESQPAQQEVLKLLIEHLLRYFPQHYQRQGDRLTNHLLDQTWQISDFTDHPLDLAGRLIQEDLCLLLPTPTGYVLSAASVCFPSRWTMPQKLGRPLSAIHQPVPGYGDKLERPVNQVFERLKLDYPGYRWNWSILDTPELFLQERTQDHLPNAAPEITAENAGEQLWLRVERQTLRRLINSNGVLFTIHTTVYPLDTVVQNPVLAQNLALTLEQIPPEMQQYKSLLPFRAALLNYLRSHAVQD